MGTGWKENQKKLCLAAAAGIGIYVGFQYLFPLISPFLLAFCIVRILNPWLSRVQKRTHIRKEILLAGILVLTAAGVLAAGWGILQYGAAQAGELSESWDGICGRVCGQVRIFLGDCCLFAQEHFGVNAGNLEQVVLERVEIWVEELRVELVPQLMKESWWYGKKLLSAGAFLGVGFIASLLLCKDYEGMIERLQGGEHADAMGKLFETADKILRLVAVYIKAQAVILLTIVLVCCTGLWTGRVEKGIFLGFLAGILDVFPFIGTGIVLLPTAFWQLVNGRGFSAVWCVVLYVVCVGVREYLEPRLMGKQTGISPVFMLLGVYAGVKLFGISGIIKGPLAVVLLGQLWGKAPEG